VFFSLARSMGKGDSRGRSYEPPPQNFRKKVGQFNAKVGRKENKETENLAIAKKQEPFPVTKIILWLAIFGAVCAILYAYLTYVLADDDDDDLIAAAAAAAARANAMPHAAPTSRSTAEADANNNG
jgi:hypothetical protein